MTPTSRTRVTCTLAFCLTSSVLFAAGMLVPRPSDLDTHARAVAPVRSDVVVPAEPTAVPRNQPETVSKIAERAVTRRSATRAAGVMTSAKARDFSGNWVLVSRTYSGWERGGAGGGGGERQVMVSIASGAPVNCGTECTIAQNTRTLTITRPDQAGQTPPDIGVVELNLDGSESTITQANGGEFSATAKWDGGKVIVTRDFNYFSVTQTLSIEDGKLTVVTMFSLADAPVTLTYVKR